MSEFCESHTWPALDGSYVAIGGFVLQVCTVCGAVRGVPVEALQEA